MICKAVFAAGAFAVALSASGLLRAEEQPAAPQSAASPVPEAAVAKPASEPQPPAANAAAPVSAAPEVAGAANEPQPSTAAHAADPVSTAPEAAAAMPASVPQQPASNAAAQAPATPEAEALHKALSALAAGQTDEERNEHAALLSFYEARGYAPLWLTSARRPHAKGKRGLRGDRARRRVGAERRRFPLAFPGRHTRAA